MSKSWNLKEERFMLDDGYELYFTHTPEEGETCLYSSDDIETLRLNLINDLEEFFQRTDIDATDREIKMVIKIINKRFGVID